MSKADEYREYAATCFRLAQEVPEYMRAQLLNMASSWHALAEIAERNQQTDVVYEPKAPKAPMQPVQQQQQQQQKKDPDA